MKSKYSCFAFVSGSRVFLSLLLASLLFPLLSYAQQLKPESLNFTPADTIAEKPVQYRRGILLQEGYQSYDEKYAGKNLNEEKRKLFPLQSTGVWTELNPKVPRVDYLGINFVNKDTGWAVGDLGTLINSTDGGTSWTVSETNTTTPILKIRSYNEQLVIASGFGGKILRSTDGGEIFTQVTSNVTGDLWGLQMLNDTLGWACGNTNSLTKTTDGGLTWQRIFTPGYTSDYWWIDFITESYGFIAANGKVLRTIDGGNNWEIIQAGDSYPLFSIDVIDSLHIAAAGYGGTGYPAKNIYSSDGGNTWVNGGQLTNEAVNCIQYVNPDTGYLVMTNVSARKTTNRGQNWTTIQGISDNYELQFIEAESIGYSSGTGLKINKADGSLDIWNRMIINDNFSDVFFVNEQTGFVISSSGFSAPSGLYKTIDSGLNWEKYPSGINGVDLFFIDSITGFIAGSTIYKTTNCGENWYAANISVTTGPIVKIFFINSTTGWAVTTYSSVQEIYILKTTDSGENWFEQYSNLFFPSFTSIHFVDSLYGWISCINGRPFKTTDSGENWIEQTSSGIGASRDIYFINRDTGWIVDNTSWRVVKKTTNEGINWLTIPEILNPFEFNFFSDPNHWLISGTPQKYITEDGGNSWIEITNDVPFGFNGFNAVSDKLGYAVGGLGLILRYEDTTYVPVELILLEGKVENNNVALRWITASELNNYGFYVQKSYDKEDWFDLGFVEGKGTATEINYYAFTDNKALSDIQYYRLKQQDYDGSLNYSESVGVEVTINNFALSQNFPNPFNPVTKIKYEIPLSPPLLKGESEAGEFITLKVYDMIGNEVATLVNEEKQPGIYEVEFDGKNFSSGVYICQLKTENYLKTIKMLLLK